MSTDLSADLSKVQYVFGAIALSLLGSYLLLAQNSSMSFFVTSTGHGNGADLGGLTGADRQCQTLVAAAGGGDGLLYCFAIN